MEDNDFIPATDRIEGAAAIGAFLGLTERQVRWRIEKGLIPVAKDGERIYASRRRLRAKYIEETSGNAA
jgi:hypothetical protein